MSPRHLRSHRGFVITDVSPKANCRRAQPATRRRRTRRRGDRYPLSFSRSRDPRALPPLFPLKLGERRAQTPTDARVLRRALLGTRLSHERAASAATIRRRVTPSTSPRGRSSRHNGVTKGSAPVTSQQAYFFFFITIRRHLAVALTNCLAQSNWINRWLP